MLFWGLCKEDFGWEMEILCVFLVFVCYFVYYEGVDISIVGIIEKIMLDL